MELKIDDLEGLLTVLADKKRLSILASLQNGSLTAREIEEKIQTSQPTTSFHLKKLVDANILSVRQEGIRKNYQVRDPQLFDMLNSINAYLSSINMSAGEKFQDISKIAVLGLDGSGKTALILSLSGHKNLLSFYSLQPTAGLKTIQNIRATYWELGGQVIYREDYIKNPQQYLEDTDNLFFVIDVQDIKRYDEALNYLSQILAILPNVKKPGRLVIFLHKFDPILDNPEEYTDVKIHDRLIGKIVAMVPPLLNCEIYKSSIFTVFQKSLLVQVGRFP